MSPRRERRARPEAAIATAPPDPARARARRAALVAAAAVLALWGIAPFVPGMGLWGVNVLRFSGLLGWALWAFAAGLCALAAVGRLDDAADALGRAFDKRPVLVAAALALVTAIVVLALPDRVFYTGDFLFRRGLNEVELQKSPLAPQLMPLDRFIHLSFAPAMRDALGLSTVDTDRWLGAIDAVLLALAAAWFVRAMRARGAAAIALAAAIVFGGGLSIFTGYGKSFVEMSVLVVALAACALECAGRGRHAVPLALFAVAYLALHRTGFVVLPATLVALVLGWRAHASDPRARREILVAGVVLVAGLAALAPRAISILRAYDVAHHTPGAMFAPLRLADLANAAILLAPLLPAALAAFAVRPRTGRTADALVLAVLAASFAALAFGAFPQQGVVRDVDVFVPTALACTCLAAFVLWGAFEERRAGGGAALALLAVTAATSLAWMAHQHDTERGFARVRAIVQGPPVRASGERSMSLDFLGAATFRMSRFDDAANAYRDAAVLTPNPRYFVQWGVAARNAGRNDEARSAFRKAVERNPGLMPAWRMLAVTAAQAGDYEEAARALAAAQALAPEDAALARDAAAVRARANADAARPSAAGAAPSGTATPASPPSR